MFDDWSKQKKQMALIIIVAVVPILLATGLVICGAGFVFYFSAAKSSKSFQQTATSRPAQIKQAGSSYRILSRLDTFKRSNKKEHESYDSILLFNRAKAAGIKTALQSSVQGIS